VPQGRIAAQGKLLLQDNFLVRESNNTHEKDRKVFFFEQCVIFSEMVDKRAEELGFVFKSRWFPLQRDYTVPCDILENDGSFWNSIGDFSNNVRYDYFLLCLVVCFFSWALLTNCFATRNWLDVFTAIHLYITFSLFPLALPQRREAQSSPWFALKLFRCVRSIESTYPTDRAVLV